MKNVRILALFLLVAITLFPLSAYAETMSLHKLVSLLNAPRATSFQTMERVNEYKDETVRGSGRVKDVLKSFGTEGEAMVYLKKRINGKTYEIILMVLEEDAEKIKKQRNVRFIGTFAGLTFQTLRFEDAEIVPKSWLDFLG